MTPGSAVAARAIGDAAGRELASEWGGPDPRTTQSGRRAMAVVAVPHAPGRRVTVRRP